MAIKRRSSTTRVDFKNAHDSHTWVKGKDGKSVYKRSSVLNKGGSNSTTTTTTSDITINGQFVSSIFILICCLFIIIGVVGSVRHEPMDMLITCAKKVGNYGNGFKDDLVSFSDTMKTFTLEEGKTYSIFFNGNYTDFRLAEWVGNVGNGILSVVKILLVVPVAIGLFAFNWNK